MVATGGCFDLVHAGHVGLLESARRIGDCLIVCLNSDDSVTRRKGPGRPLTTAADRAKVLAALGSVDAVVIFEEDTPERVLGRLRPDVWVKGATTRCRICRRRRCSGRGVGRRWYCRTWTATRRHCWRGGPRMRLRWL